MYVPAHFEEPRKEVLHDLIERAPLGILFTNGRSGMDANHIPFHVSKNEGQHGILHCHVARANPVWEDIATGDEVLVVFRAADAYISPNWYPSKREFRKQVPTWNYTVAHAYGRATIRDDERYVRGVIARLTRTHESKQENPWKMSDSPKDYIDAMVKNIVGIEVEITKLVGKLKLSQNREARDILEAGETLQKLGSEQIGDAMLAFGTEKAKRYD
ncbi:FMN-binding negative transcriptional regulator [Dongia sp.]|uniref:FMN-binding negative transcriptional regulator n=1 Tax=Dongia sp. TaxID=1977262 RepID=UPI0035B1663B